MSFASSWTRLPGPADFLEAVIEDLADGNSVFAGLPDFGSELSLPISEMVKRKGLQWSAVRRPEASQGKPEKSVERRRNGRVSQSLVLWVDGMIQDEGTSIWADYARQIAGTGEELRFCIAMPMSYAEACMEDRGLRRRLWKNFVTSSDSRVLVERLSRRSEFGQMHIALKSTLIEELAGPDLNSAARLADKRLGSILKENHSKEPQIWTAQVKVLFPLIDREQRSLRKAFQWALPHSRENGSKVTRLGDLEIGDMVQQGKEISTPEPIKERLNWLHRVRNKLAHYESVPWETLISPTALKIVDFRERNSR